MNTHLPRGGLHRVVLLCIAERRSLVADSLGARHVLCVVAGKGGYKIVLTSLPVKSYLCLMEKIFILNQIYEQKKIIKIKNVHKCS